MKKVLTFLFFAGFTTVAFAQPQPTDEPRLIGEDMVITVIEGTEYCDVEPGVYQLVGDGFSKIVDLEPLPNERPELVMKRNSDLIFDVLNTVGLPKMEVKDYREFWIDECSKQSQYVLVEKSSLIFSAHVE